ncbi:MAG: hypothetical protein ACI8QY_000187, partial [bacterium]
SLEFLISEADCIRQGQVMQVKIIKNKDIYSWQKKSPDERAFLCRCRGFNHP